ncbi:FitA-like ribbon-helix-helix domain-containing protein [Gordonia rhizosphera NBRC 16068]|uniref:FitA-like ribbon-helix-helix domain-containing protein n=1 Tax=Gordonia rhizosphera TaxID=83341 RepID=UPI003EE13CEE
MNRGLPPGTKAALRARAEQHHRSVEATTAATTTTTTTRAPCPRTYSNAVGAQR